MHVFGVCSGDGGSEEDDEDMDVDTSKVTHALAVADALGRTQKNNNSATKFDDIADGLKELDMERYDDEDEGILGMYLLLFLFYCSLCWSSWCLGLINVHIYIIFKYMDISESYRLTS